MGSEHYRLRWSNHRANLLGVCAQLLRDESLVDVTLACQDGHSIRAHKVVLSACSSYLAALLAAHPSHPHPIVVLTHVRGAALRPLVEFMYRGEVRVRAAVLPALLDAAESLQVKGLAEMTREYLTSAASSKPDVVEPEQTEPEELVIRRPPSQPHHQRGPPSPGVASSEGGSTHRSPSPPGTPQNLRICRSPISPGGGGRDPEQPPKRPRSSDSGSPAPTVPAIGCAPSDTNQHNSGHNFILGGSAATVSHKPPSPSACEPVPGPSSLGPAQQVPLSLKKEVDWGGDTDIKTEKESTSDFPKYHHDSDVKSETCADSSSTDRTLSSCTSPNRSTTPFGSISGTGALVQPPFTHPAALLEVGLVHPSLFTASDELFRCSSCMAAFPSLWLLEQHAALQHIGVLPAFDKPFVCDQCGQSYRYRSAYVKHREQNHRARLPADKLFSCDVCGMQFRYLKSFKKHRLNHALERLHGGRIMTGENSQPLYREDSPKTPEDLSMPPKVEESREETSPIEQSSDQVSSSNEVINVDEEIEPVVVKKESFVEDASMETTSSDAEQDATIDSALSLPSANLLDGPGLSQRSPPTGGAAGEIRRFACPFCGKCVRSKENLKLHVRKHTGERPFACLFCGRAFGGKSDLTRHLRIHTGERPYHCDMCGKCFARADYLSKHLTTHINTPRS